MSHLHHFAYGLCLQVDFALPEVPSVDLQHGCTADVVIRNGKCPLHLAQPHNPTELDDGSLLLYWEQVGGFWIRDGGEIVVEPGQHAANVLLRAVLLGPVLAVFLLQRGYLVLHASAVSVQPPSGLKRGVGFLGHSTQGKSTMAKAMSGRGYQVITDDIMAVPLKSTPRPKHQSKPQPYSIPPSLPHLKLRAPSVKAFGENLDSLSLWHPKEDGYVVPLSDKFSLEPAPLQCLYVLQESESIGIHPLSAHDALAHIVDHSYCIRSVDNQLLGDGFLKCAELIRQIPVFLLQRPKDFQLLPEVARRVEEHQASLFGAIEG